MIAQLQSYSRYIPKEDSPYFDLYRIYRQGFGTKEAWEKVSREKNITADNFRKLNERLKKNLIERIDPSLGELSKFNQAYFDIIKKHEAATLLLWLDEKEEGVRLAKKTLAKSERYGITWVSLSLSKKLRYHYSNIKVSQSDFYRYGALARKYGKEYANEEAAEALLCELAFCIKRRESFKHLEGEIMSLAKIESDSHFFLLFSYYAQMLWHKELGEVDKMVEICHRALNRFQQFEQPIPYTCFSVFLRSLIPYLIRERQFEKAVGYVRKCLALPKKGSLNWHNAAFLKTLIYLHASQYGAAVRSYKMAMATPYKGERKEINERWRMVRCYLEALHLTGRVEKVGDFRFRKMLNSMPSLSRDKENANVAGIIAEMVLLLLQGRKMLYLENTVLVKSYANRNLKERPRLKAFLLMICKLPDADWNEGKAVKKAAHWKGVLESSPMRFVESEIINFELLWEIILEQL